jgi:hypothetical protein
MMATLPVPPPAPSPAPVPAPAPVRVETPATPPAPEKHAPAPSTQAAIAAVKPKSSAASLLGVVAVIVILAGAFAYMKLRPETAHVTVTLASPREWVSFYDGTSPAKKAEAQALSFGEAGKVTDVVAKGTETRPGMPLASLEQYAQVEKQLADVKDRAAFYQKQLDAATAKKDDAAMKTAEAKVAEKKKLITELEARAAKVRLVAPGTGVVTDVLVTAGGDARPGDPAVKVGDKRVSVDFTVPAEGAPKMGDNVSMTGPSGGATIAGKVTAVRAGAITVELPENTPVKVSDPLRLVKKREQNVIPLPASAVIQRDGADVVFVLADGEAHQRKVTVLDRSANEVLIASGLAAGDSVITSSANLQEGQKASAQ